MLRISMVFSYHPEFQNSNENTPERWGVWKTTWCFLPKNRVPSSQKEGNDFVKEIQVDEIPSRSFGSEWKPLKNGWERKTNLSYWVLGTFQGRTFKLQGGYDQIWRLSQGQPSVRAWGEILLMDQKSGVHQLRLVVYPIVYRVLYIQTVAVWDFWTINSMIRNW